MVDAVTSAADAHAPPPAAPKPKTTFMLHNPDDMSSKGKYVSTDYRYAALKAASRGHGKIYLRKTNTKEVRMFEGSIVPLTNPKKIHRGDRVIEYNRKPTVKYVGSFVFEGQLPEDEDGQQP